MSCKDTAIIWKSPVNIRNYSPDVEADDGLAAEGGFEKAEVFSVVVKEALCEGGGAEGSGKDGEIGFEVWICHYITSARLVHPFRPIFEPSSKASASFLLAISPLRRTL